MSGAVMSGDPVSDTTARQRKAAMPDRSAWVSANAGSGKTKVLSDRVLRLLLEGVAPNRILCLTFTKAAAANMQMRVFDRLAAWVTHDDARLAQALRDLDGREPDAGRLALARRLFARAVETPGGLKIGTIHAFCERLLHIAPFEAGVPARFAMLDEVQGGILFDAAMTDALAHAGADATLRLAFDILDAAHGGGDGRTALIKAAMRHRPVLRDEAALEAAFADIRARLEVREGESLEALEAEVLAGGIPVSEWADLVALFQAGSTKDHERADTLIAAAGTNDPAQRSEHYLKLFFTKDGKGTPYKSLGTKAIPDHVKERLSAEQERLVALRLRMGRVEAWQRTWALFVIARAVFRRIEARKARLSMLDFDDLIEKTRDLLAGPAGGWVLYKLDRGIDHVLVDEAQDTNPAQWDILRAVTGDFFAGAGQKGAGAPLRTVFAVGDEKQSIYSFQGAEPRKFSESRRYWEAQAQGVAQAFENVQLTVSFRTAPAILQAVDAVFCDERNFEGLSFEDDITGTAHQSSRLGVPARVEIWPFEPAASEPDPDAWTHPLDELDATAPPVQLARRIAQAVETWTRNGDATGRIWQPGEILILTRSRNPAFFATIRALKDRNIPVAGADRLDIAAHIAVQDLVAAGRTALLPGDDLTLATVLKSPLVGWDDDDLIRIGVGRKADESLHDAFLRHAGEGDAKTQAAAAQIGRWRELAARHGPFAFFAALLGPEGGRRRLVARLGVEAGDAIDAFLAEALVSEHPQTPSLATFLESFSGAEREIRRDLEAEGREVRVMTIHGAKGLEAPLVLVIDQATRGGNHGAALYDIGGSLPVWSPGKDKEPEVLSEARALRDAADAQERNRLLYVALTRAADHLVIAPYGGKKDKELPADCWTARISRALEAGAYGLNEAEMPYGPVALWQEPSPGERAAQAGEAVPPQAFPLPDWLTRAHAPEPEPAPPLRPSSALTAADAPANLRDRPFDPRARQRGVLVHALIERLPAIPADRREAAARAFVAARAGGLDDAMREAVVADALSVIADPRLAPLFAPDALAEAPVSGRVGVGMTGEKVAVTGQIDRLAIGADAICFADFKTSARAPEPDKPLSARYLSQMALYRALLAQIYPDRAIRAFMVWTAGPQVRELDTGELEAALRLITPPEEAG
ncbi:MAG: double-strand break repair helicase AddA [Salinarimonas sp.]|nr:double-strand break repair helicase AddA [Salinarimonas sp.]